MRTPPPPHPPHLEFVLQVRQPQPAGLELADEIRAHEVDAVVAVHQRRVGVVGAPAKPALNVALQLFLIPVPVPVTVVFLVVAAQVDPFESKL